MSCNLHPNGAQCTADCNVKVVLPDNSYERPVNIPVLAGAPVSNAALREVIAGPIPSVINLYNQIYVNGEIHTPRFSKPGVGTRHLSTFLNLRPTGSLCDSYRLDKNEYAKDGVLLNCA